MSSKKKQENPSNNNAEQELSALRQHVKEACAEMGDICDNSQRKASQIDRTFGGMTLALFSLTGILSAYVMFTAISNYDNSRIDLNHLQDDRDSAIQETISNTPATLTESFAANCIAAQIAPHLKQAPQDTSSLTATINKSALQSCVTEKTEIAATQKIDEDITALKNEKAEQRTGFLLALGIFCASLALLGNVAIPAVTGSKNIKTKTDKPSR